MHLVAILRPGGGEVLTRAADVTAEAALKGGFFSTACGLASVVAPIIRSSPRASSGLACSGVRAPSAHAPTRCASRRGRL